jgi:hypothetical protein
MKSELSLAGFLDERAAWIHQIARQTAVGIVEIGRILTEVRERLPDGEFLKWIDREFAWSEWTVRRFINVHEQFKSSNLHDLQIDVSALYLIAAPKTPEPVRQEAIRQASLGHVSHATVKAVIEEYRDTDDEQTAQRLFETVRALQRQDAEAAKQLPSPAEARLIAIETGAHTPDRNGVYQPPMTVEQQEAWRADLHLVSRIKDFIRFVCETDGLDIGELVAIIEARHWRADFQQSAQAAAWLTEFAREISWLALRWSDIQGGRVIIARSLTQVKDQVATKETKGKNIRVVTLPDSIWPVLENHRREQDKFKQQDGRPSHHDLDLIFANEDGSPMKPNSVS